MGHQVLAIGSVPPVTHAEKQVAGVIEGYAAAKVPPRAGRRNRYQQVAPLHQLVALQPGPSQGGGAFVALWFAVGEIDPVPGLIARDHGNIQQTTLPGMVNPGQIMHLARLPRDGVQLEQLPGTQADKQLCVIQEGHAPGYACKLGQFFGFVGSGCISRKGSGYAEKQQKGKEQSADHRVY